ncbi:MAG: HpaII family restriction endonuclease [Saprospiraceae bacterium]|nr:HpaII family restriction endonuclease [Candidatus Vicinibacter affinis]
MLKGNKGDWSELYVFAKLLSEGKLFQSDINLNRDVNNYYEVVKAYREEGKSSLEFERNGKILLYSVSGGTRNLIGDFSIDYLKEISEKYLQVLSMVQGNVLKYQQLRTLLKIQNSETDC